MIPSTVPCTANINSSTIHQPKRISQHKSGRREKALFGWRERIRTESRGNSTETSLVCCLNAVDMGAERDRELTKDKGNACGTMTLCVHAFADLRYVPPAVFIYLLKQCYIHGTCKATKKFRSLQQQVHLVLYNSPQPEPAAFVLRCLYMLPVLGQYSDGFSHLIISGLRRFQKVAATSEDTSKTKVLAAHLFLDIVRGVVNHEERILVKILEVFDIRLTDIDTAIEELKAKNDYSFESAKEFIEQYIFKLIESGSYLTAVSLLEQFSIRQSGQSFLLKMMQNNQSKAAEKWATFMGKPMLMVLVQEYVNRNMLKNAYDTIKKNDLKEEFPDVYLKCKESSLKKFAEKALWDLAEAKTHGDKQLIEYLVYLAMEAGYSEKVDELCERYSLEGFVNAKEPEANLLCDRYLHLNELVDDFVWVDDVKGLRDATHSIEGGKVVGIDCEWKPNFVKGSKPNKVSIMQIASDKLVFIFDLIKLSEDVPGDLDDCLTRILQSPSILKLGYNFQCDIQQLAHSYEDLKCFKHYEMLLDIQNIFRETRGGLSGLSKKILGTGLNKARRNSNWEQRPLTHNQLEYAALDAAVLLHIFRHVRTHSQPSGVSEGQKIEWKSHIVSRMDNPKKTKKRSERSKW